MSEELEIGNFTGVQKAAILIMYLDRDISRRLLENLSDTEVKEIGMAMSTIEKISPQEIEVVYQIKLLVDGRLLVVEGLVEVHHNCIQNKQTQKRNS